MAVEKDMLFVNCLRSDGWLTTEDENNQTPGQALLYRNFLFKKCEETEDCFKCTKGVNCYDCVHDIQGSVLQYISRIMMATLTEEFIQL